MKTKLLGLFAFTVLLNSCYKHHDDFGDFGEYSNEDASTFAEIGSIKVGETGAAEITAYDPETKKLFVVTNSGSSRIDVLDLTNPATPVRLGFIDITPYGGGVNSVAVNDGRLAAAVEGFVKTDNGKAVIFKTKDHSLVAEVPVGALPDMITYTHDGKYILTANEGEPNDAYTIDPVGSVSIISVGEKKYQSNTIDFSGFASQQANLQSRGLRVYGPNATLATNIEPEYITISFDSKTAWVTLQENNAIAKLDIRSRKITNIFPLGFKSYALAGNEMDPSDRDGNLYKPASWNVKGMYQPDALAVYEKFGTPFIITANEGDARDYPGYSEMKRMKDSKLDPTVFADATLKTDPKLGRLNITQANGDIDNDGDLDELYSLGSRSFSVWNGNTGRQVFDSKNQLDAICSTNGVYDDGRSDDKSVEPEGVALGWVGKRPVAFIGLERADAVAIYDISQPDSPVFIKLLKTGDAPEGLTFISAKDSPSKKSLLVVSSENDGVVKIYQVN